MMPQTLALDADSMEMAGTALAFYGLGAAALATSLVALKRRLRLSKAKHASLDVSLP